MIGRPFIHAPRLPGRCYVAVELSDGSTIDDFSSAAQRALPSCSIEQKGHLISFSMHEAYWHLVIPFLEESSLVLDYDY